MKSSQVKKPKVTISDTVIQKTWGNYPHIMELMRKVQLEQKEAELNEASMSDNNGGRIKYKKKRKKSTKLLR